jgi:hypothetical protein
MAPCRTHPLESGLRRRREGHVERARIRAMLRKPVEQDELYRLLRSHLPIETPQY